MSNLRKTPNQTQWSCIYNAMRRNTGPANKSKQAIQKACDAVLADIANHRPDILTSWDIRVTWDGSMFDFTISDRSVVDQLASVVDPVKPKTPPPQHGRPRSESALMADGREWWEKGMIVRAVEYDVSGVVSQVGYTTGRIRVKWDKDRALAEHLPQWINPKDYVLKVVA